MSKEEQQKAGVYVRMPRGYTKPGKVLKLNRSLYGLKQSPRNYFLYMKDKLEASGFIQSKHDACLFFTDKVICLVYVDDTLFFAHNTSEIEEVIDTLKSVSTLQITTEDDIAGFLGVHINNRDDGTIELLQTGLIDRIIEALDLGDAKATKTPAILGCLSSDEDRIGPQGVYDYRSVIGMLLYLSGHSRPDIHFAMIQCARFLMPLRDYMRRHLNT